MYNSILFTHDDMDGYGCKLALDIRCSVEGMDSPEEYEIVNCGNHKIDQTVMEYVDQGNIGEKTIVFFADIVPSAPVLEDLGNKVKVGEIGEVRVFDHHESNLYANDIEHISAQIVPTGSSAIPESGASLLYKHLFDGIAVVGINFNLFSDVIDNIRSYDTYEWKVSKNINAKKLNILFGMIGGDNFVRRYRERILHNDPCSDLIVANDLEFVNCKFQAEQKAIDKVTEDDVVCAFIRGYKVAILMKSVFANFSELAYQFLNKYPQYDAMIEFNLLSGGSFSFRSVREDINVSDIFAVPLGGGGHPKASGSPLPDFIKDLLRDIACQWLNGDEFSVTVAGKNVAERYDENKSANFTFEKEVTQ